MDEPKDEEISVEDLTTDEDDIPENRIVLDLPIGGIAVVVFPGTTGFHVRMAQYTPGPEVQLDAEQERDVIALNLLGRGIVNAVTNDTEYLFNAGQDTLAKDDYGVTEVVTKDSSLLLLKPMGTA